MWRKNRDLERLVKKLEKELHEARNQDDANEGDASDEEKQDSKKKRVVLVKTAKKVLKRKGTLKRKLS